MDAKPRFPHVFSLFGGAAGLIVGLAMLIMAWGGESALGFFIGLYFTIVNAVISLGAVLLYKYPVSAKFWGVIITVLSSVMLNPFNIPLMGKFSLLLLPNVLSLAGGILAVKWRSKMCGIPKPAVAGSKPRAAFAVTLVGGLVELLMYAGPMLGLNFLPQSTLTIYRLISMLILCNIFADLAIIAEAIALYKYPGRAEDLGIMILISSVIVGSKPLCFIGGILALIWKPKALEGASKPVWSNAGRESVASGYTAASVGCSM